MITSPAVELINIPSSSREEFAVEPLSLPSLEDRFRIPSAALIAMPTAFMGAAGAALFTSNHEMET